MLRARQYVKLYKKYHSFKLDQSQANFYVWFEAHRALLDITLQKNWRRYCEKNMR